MFDYTPIDIFKFEKRDITTHMLYHLHMGRKIKDSFSYLAGKLGVQKLKQDLSKLKWSKGKNYSWAFVQHENVTFGIRQYDQHFTIFSKRDKNNDDWYARYAVFTFATNMEQLSASDHDSRYDDRCQDLSAHITQLFELAAKDKLHGLWNNLTFKRPDYINVKMAWSGSDDDVDNIDLFTFACEEIFQKTLEIFSETDMLEAVSKVRVGQKLGEYEVISVRKAVKDEYYHGVGIEWQSKREKKWNDVYSLTRWYYAEMFPQGFTLKA